MSDPTREPTEDAPLNPALRSSRETQFETEPTPAPLETTNAHAGQGEGWPIVWLVVVILGVIATIYFLL